MTGRLAIVGLGPGAAELQTPQAADALMAATDLVGYGPYLDRVPTRGGQTRHPSDNREELARARHALSLAAAGRQVAVVSSGDAGVFAMFAVAARIGAPLGHDFCAISLSDNLKSWDTVVRRLTAAAEAGFVIALYNPTSVARPWQLGEAFTILRPILPPETLVVFATAVTRPEERIDVVTLAEADPARADMRTLVMIGSPATRRIERPAAQPWVYTSRREGDMTR